MNGYYMPAEFSRQRAAILIFPERPGSWGKSVSAASAFAEIINTLSEHEDVYVAVNERSRANAGRLLRKSDRIKLLDISTDDSWARDVAPTFVKNPDTGDVRGISWRFNAWGGNMTGFMRTGQRTTHSRKLSAKKRDLPA